MRYHLAAALFLCAVLKSAAAEELTLPEAAAGWKVELVAKAPEILFPTAVVQAPDGTLYLGQDPMDMPGPPTAPIDSVVTWKNGKVGRFAEQLWSVMGLEWVDDTLYVVHAPFLSALRDTDGDGKADSRVDLITGLGPKVPGFNGINDHVASGLRMGMDGFLYIAVGDKGLPKAVAKDGTSVQLFGGGVIRIRPDGTGLEVVSTGECNPLSVALSDTDEIFTLGNDDDSKRWPNSLTHHIVGGHYGFPYDFLLAPWRALPIMGGEFGGAGAQGVCYNDDGLPPPYRGNLLFCDWGRGTVDRFVLKKAGGTFALEKKTVLISKGRLGDFRPFSLAVDREGTGFWLTDWAYDGWLADGPKTGRLYHLSYEGPDRVKPAPRPVSDDPETCLAALDHPALSARMAAQRFLARRGAAMVPRLVARLKKAAPESGRRHALWALDAIGTPEAARSIRAALGDRSAELRLQAARSNGIRRDRQAFSSLTALLRDREAAVRREAAIALGKLGDASAGPALIAALGDSDGFASWSIRHAIRTLEAWDEKDLTAAFLDEARREDALKLCDEAWSVPAVSALAIALEQSPAADVRGRIVAALAGQYRRYPAWSGDWFGTNPLAGRMPRKSQDWKPEGMAGVLRGLSIGLVDRDDDVRFQAIAALRATGPEGAARVRSLLTRETNERNLAAVAEALGALHDVIAIPTLAAWIRDPKRSETVRSAALDALEKFAGPQALTARLSLVYEPKAPAALVARALVPLGQAGVLPANDVAGFLENPAPAIRAAALRALSAGRPVPEEVKSAVTDRVNDRDLDVRKAAIAAIARLKIRDAIPRLLSVANEEPLRAEATLALAAVPDPQALPLYVSALSDRSPVVRRKAEEALLAIRGSVAPDLEKLARSTRMPESASLAVERVLTRFRPIVDWRVIGPFPRTTAPILLGEASINFAQPRSGANGKPIAWRARKGDPDTGRVVLDELKAAAGERAGFGYDADSTPDLGSFGFAEVDSPAERSALLLIGSSGSITVAVNEQVVDHFVDSAGRPFAPDSDVVRVRLKQGTNRILVASRQGIGVWSFGVQVGEPSARPFAASGAVNLMERLRAFALSHEGDPKRGAEIFFDPKGIGCGKCHSAGGRGAATLGPDLTGIALKYNQAELIRSVLEPSARLATGFQPVVLALRDGRVVTGLVRSETETTIELADADANVNQIVKEAIVERRVSDVSMMPKGTADVLSPVEFADLIQYLRELKAEPQRENKRP